MPTHASCWPVPTGATTVSPAKRLRLSPTTVGKWRARCVRDPLDGLI
jgi:hypothetical protein